MKNALIIHGMPDKKEYLASGAIRASDNHWIPWLKEYFYSLDIKTETPEMPEPYAPNYKKWKSVFEKYELTPETILVGHSCGAGFLVRWLSENKVSVGKVVLVAPWMDPTKEFTTEMFDFIINPDIIEQCAELTVMYSADDDGEVTKTVDELKAVFPQVAYKEFSNKGHFTLEDMGTTAFPEILEVLGL